MGGRPAVDGVRGRETRAQRGDDEGSRTFNRRRRVFVWYVDPQITRLTPVKHGLRLKPRKASV